MVAVVVQGKFGSLPRVYKCRVSGRLGRFFSGVRRGGQSKVGRWMDVKRRTAVHVGILLLTNQLDWLPIWIWG